MKNDTSKFFDTNNRDDLMDALNRTKISVLGGTGFHDEEGEGYEMDTRTGNKQLNQLNPVSSVSKTGGKRQVIGNRDADFYLGQVDKWGNPVG